MNELEARFSPNPIFTGLLQEDGPESAARQVFGQVEVGHPVGHLTATPGVVHDPEPDVDDLFPYRASRFYRSPAAQAAAEVAAIPVVVGGLVSATPTGSINLRLRKVVDPDG